MLPSWWSSWWWWLVLLLRLTLEWDWRNWLCNETAERAGERAGKEVCPDILILLISDWIKCRLSEILLQGGRVLVPCPSLLMLLSLFLQKQNSNSPVSPYVDVDVVSGLSFCFFVSRWSSASLFLIEWVRERVEKESDSISGSLCVYVCSSHRWWCWWWYPLISLSLLFTCSILRRSLDCIIIISDDRESSESTNERRILLRSFVHLFWISRLSVSLILLLNLVLDTDVSAPCVLRDFNVRWIHFWFPILILIPINNDLCQRIEYEHGSWFSSHDSMAVLSTPSS